jgi:hypothetical protein
MNCKPGDMAIIIRSVCPNNVGKVVTCGHVLTQSELLEWHVLERYGAIWMVDRPITWTYAFRFGTRQAPLAADNCLMPINPLADDETDDSQLTERTPCPDYAP